MVGSVTQPGISAEVSGHPHTGLWTHSGDIRAPECVSEQVLSMLQPSWGQLEACVSSKLALECHNSNTKVTKPAVALQK